MEVGDRILVVSAGEWGIDYNLIGMRGVIVRKANYKCDYADFFVDLDDFEEKDYPLFREQMIKLKEE